MNILILGGSGFIGRNLVKSLTNTKHNIVSLDSVSEPPRNNITYIQADIRDLDMSELVSENDLVIDLIAYANPSLYVSDPLSTFNICFTENLKIVELCAKYKKRLIQFSTSEVYGDHGDESTAWNEHDTTFITGPTHEIRWIYSSAKQTLERLIYAYGLKQSLEYTIIRPFNFIGHDIDYLPSSQPGCPRVFSHFLDAILNGGIIKLVNGGEQRRAYTYIDDAIECIVKIINNPTVCKNKIFNIGSPNNETTIANLAHLMINTALENEWIEDKPTIESTTGTKFYGKGYADITRRVPCIKSICDVVDWNPTTTLENTILYSMKPWFGD
jgi:nucleoside-diphosphate-sugar epimerase